nr:hypothetical protein [Tanacetum cinerariifolium]
MTRHHGTVAAAEIQYEVRNSVRDSESPEIQYEIQKVQKFSTRFRNSVQGSEKKSILEADVAQCDWWIKNLTAANDEI